MKIQEAVDKFDKFRRKEWKEDKYLHFQSNILVNQDGRPAFFGKASFKNDWEIYEEPNKTLWEKHLCRSELKEGLYFHQDNVKEALKELLNNWKDDSTQNYLYKKAKEIFGKEMLQKEND